MSMRDSVGDLVPRDVAEILAQVRQTSKGRKHHGGSIGRAFSWLKGKRRKKKKKKKKKGIGGSNGQSWAEPPVDGTGDQYSHSLAKVAPRQEDDGKLAVPFSTSRYHQENVFVEGSRPKYLEDLHSEAQEGLKIQQLEENKDGVDYPDDQSISSTVTYQPGEDASFRERKSSLESSSTTADTMSTVSSVSTWSTRSALTRQKSTFRPLNQGKRSDKPRRKSRRSTVMGIPQQLQKELGLDKRAWLQSGGRLPNGGSSAIPSSDGEIPTSVQQGACVGRLTREALQSAQEDHLLKHQAQTRYGVDFAHNHGAGPHPSPLMRPRSLAAPGMTTSGSLLPPPSPVMSISPQATYLSKIIPNAVMPASVDLVEISRNRSRSSIRTLSKNSLMTASPASSRRYDFSSQSSTWSHSQSSETIVSDSSTISSQGGGSTPRAIVGGKGDGGDGYRGASPYPLSVSNSCVNGSQGEKNSQSAITNGRLGAKGDTEALRSLSIMKAMRPPPPPRRTNSLHQDKYNSHSREVVEIISSQKFTGSGFNSYVEGEKGATEIFGSTNSPLKLTLQTAMSPSSGYSSQNDTPMHSAIEFGSPLRGGQKPCFLQTQSKATPLVVTAASNRISPAPASIALRKLFEVPPPPKVQAPAPPPPETWIHNQRTVDLVCGLNPNRFVMFKKKQPHQLITKRGIVSSSETKGSNTQSKEKTTSVQTVSETIHQPAESLVAQKKKLQLIDKKSALSVNHKEPEQAQENPQIQMKGLLRQVAPEMKPASPEVQKKNLPEVIKKKSSPILFRREPGKVPESPLARKIAVNNKTTSKEDPSSLRPQEDTPVPPLASNTSMHSLSVGAPKLVGLSPPPSPPPAHQPPPPPVKQDTTTSLTPETNPGRPNSGSSWPLPPPPIEQLSGAVFERQDNLDSAPPPPLSQGTLQDRAGNSSTAPLTQSPAGVSLSTASLGGSPMKVEEPLAAPATVTTTFTQVNPPLKFPPLPENIPPPPQQAPPPPPSAPAKIPPAPPMYIAHQLPVQKQTLADIIRQTSLENKSKEQLSRSKSMQTPNEDATSLPLVTPSLLQMVRLRSVNTGDSQTEVLSEVSNPSPGQNQSRDEGLNLLQKSGCKSELPPPPINTYFPHAVTSSAPTVISAQTTITSAPPTAISVPPTVIAASPTIISAPPTVTSASPSVISAPPTLISALPPVTSTVTAAIPPSPSMIPSPPTVTSSPPTVTSSPPTVTAPPPTVTAPPPTVTATPSNNSPSATITSHSTRLQEAIRMKTAAMSSRDGLPTRLNIRTLSPNGTDLQKSPASTASFIFSKSTKKVVVETSSAESQPDLKQNLVNELMSISDHDKVQKSGKVPPPVARKPSLHLPNPDKPECPADEQHSPSDSKPHRETEKEQLAGQEAQSKEDKRCSP